MKANIDLHGAPGSQNGFEKFPRKYSFRSVRFDNSGRAGEANWVKEGQVDRTKEVLRMISVTVRAWVEEGAISETTIYSWCVLNEPAGWEVGTPPVFQPNTKILSLERDMGRLQG